LNPLSPTNTALIKGSLPLKEGERRERRERRGNRVEEREEREENGPGKTCSKILGWGPDPVARFPHAYDNFPPELRGLAAGSMLWTDR